jgi:hypothetical protein
MIDPRFIVVKENIKNMMKYSKNEYQKYKKTRNIIYLQQAGEKLFNAIENYIGLANKVFVDSFYSAKQLTMRNKPLRKLLYDGRALHRFFYNSTNELDAYEAESLYIRTYKNLNERIRRLV